MAIMGPSGCGKSTLLSILGAMASSFRGSGSSSTKSTFTRFRRINRQDFRREYLGFVFQQLQLIPYLTAIENVMLPLVVSDVKDKRQAARNVLERVGLENKMDRLPSELSAESKGGSR